MAPERKRPTRSQLYQHLLVEKAFSHEMMETFSNDDSVYKKLNPFNYNEEILVLEDQLKERFWEIINEHLTPRQLEIINLLKSGKTQSETAKALSVNQSSITKCLSFDSTLFFENKKETILEIYNKWVSDKKILENYNIYSINEETNIIFLSKIVDVMYSGIKEVIKATTQSGKCVKATKEHKVFTNFGWLKLGEAVEIGAKLATAEGFIDEVVNFEEITKVSEPESVDTYDIEVRAPWHNFLQDGVIVRNSLNGNVDYSKSAGKASYGGIVKKLDRVIQKDPIIKEILEKISDLRNDTWI